MNFFLTHRAPVVLSPEISHALEINESAELGILLRSLNARSGGAAGEVIGFPGEERREPEPAKAA